MFKVMGEGVSHVQGDGSWRRASVMFNVIKGGEGRNAMYKVMGGVRGVSHVQGDGRG